MGIIVATSLVVIENLAWIAEPALFGNVIDALIEKATSEIPVSYIAPLLIWIGAFLLNSGVGALRRWLDPRIFLKMFTQIATDVSRSAKEKGHS
ncbi:MAG: ABC transporter six-transmembrane domain-containing protein, partial [Bacteroidota bacterium]